MESPEPVAAGMTVTAAILSGVFLSSYDLSVLLIYVLKSPLLWCCIIKIDNSVTGNR